MERGCDGWCDTSRELKGDEWFEQDALPGVYRAPGSALRSLVCLAAILSSITAPMVPRPLVALMLR